MLSIIHIDVFLTDKHTRCSFYFTNYTSFGEDFCFSNNTVSSKHCSVAFNAADKFRVYGFVSSGVAVYSNTHTMCVCVSVHHFASWISVVLFDEPYHITSYLYVCMRCFTITEIHFTVSKCRVDFYQSRCTRKAVKVMKNKFINLTYAFIYLYRCWNI